MLNQPMFTSERERRLWLWTGVVVAGIYATLGPGGVVAGWLRNQNLLVAAFGLCILTVGLAVLLLAWRARPSGVEIGIGLAVVAAYLFVFFRIGIVEERSHLIEYSVVGALIYAALAERKANGRHMPTPALLAIAVTGLLGAVDECLQLLLPNRVFDPADILFNLLAGAMAVSASVALGWARRWRQPGR